MGSILKDVTVIFNNLEKFALIKNQGKKANIVEIKRKQKVE